MEVRTYRARSLQEALHKIRAELGPDATILQSREITPGWWRRLSRGREFEIRVEQRHRCEKRIGTISSLGLDAAELSSMTAAETNHAIPASSDDPTMAERSRDALVVQNPPLTPPIARESTQLADLDLPTDICNSVSAENSSPEPPARPESRVANGAVATTATWSSALFDLMTELVDAEIPESTARELIECVSRCGPSPGGLPQMLERVVRELERSVATTGPIDLAEGQQKVIALVGPTGVGKTTTIAKLAANLRLCEHRRVGLITVDTYRIAAVDQLRAYAEIMDLPMEVVTTPREMREALTRRSDDDVVLIDTAGRSPHDAVHLQQLKSMLAEAMPTETQLVVSCTGSSRHLIDVIDNFSPIGCTSILVTKLDEVTALGNLVPFVRHAGLPLSYLTCGQNVPDDIVVADRSKLLQVLVGRRPISVLI